MLQLRIDSGKVSWPPLSQPPFYLWICLNSDVPTTILPLNLPGLQCSNLHLTFNFPWPPMFQPPFDLQVVLPPMSQPPLYLHIVLASSLPCPSLRPNSCWDIPSGPSPSTNLQTFLLNIRKFQVFLFTRPCPIKMVYKIHLVIFLQDY